MESSQDLKKQGNTPDNGPLKISHDAAAVLLLRLRAQYAYDNPQESPYALEYHSYSFAPAVSEKKLPLRRDASRDPQKFSNIFGDIIQLRGWGSPLAVGAVTARWSDFVGESNAAHSYVESFMDSKVVVRCDSTVWANSLRTMKKDIIEVFHREVGKSVVADIEILGPKGIPSWKKGAWSAQGRGPRDTYG